MSLLLALSVVHGEPAPTPPASPPEVPSDDAEPAADEQTEDAAKVDALVAEGSAAFEAGDHGTAIAKFKAAHELDPDPNFIYNLGRIHEDWGNLDRALEYYLRFVKQPGVDLELRRAALDRLVVVKAILAETRASEAVATQAEGEEDESTDEPPEEVPPPEPVEADDPDSSDNRVPKRGRPLRVAGYTSLGVGLVALIAGATTGILAGRSASKLEDTNDPSRRLELVDRGRQLALATDGLLIAGGIATVAGAVMTIVGVRRGRADRRGRRASIVPALVPGQVGARLSIEF